MCVCVRAGVCVCLCACVRVGVCEHVRVSALTMMRNGKPSSSCPTAYALTWSRDLGMRRSSRRSALGRYGETSTCSLTTPYCAAGGRAGGCCSGGTRGVLTECERKGRSRGYKGETEWVQRDDAVLRQCWRYRRGTVPRYHAGWDTVPCGISCRVGYHAE